MTAKLLAALCLLSQAVIFGQVGGRLQVDPLSSGRPYSLGVGDEVSIRAANAEEISDKPYRIESDGMVALPLVGRIQAAGLTVEQFESAVVTQLARYVRSPQVNVSVSQFRTESVTLSGAFKSPGVYSLQGRHSLTEVLASSGGLTTNASRILRITRLKEQGSIPLPDVRMLADGSAYVATIDTSIQPDGQTHADDFTLKPFDLLTAVYSDPIWLSGEVSKIGPLELGERKGVTLTQALMMSGGLTHDASKHIKVYRPIPDSPTKSEYTVDLEKLLKGQEPDFALLPKDVVFVPRATGQAVARKLAALALTSGLAIFTGLAITR